MGPCQTDAFSPRQRSSAAMSFPGIRLAAVPRAVLRRARGIALIPPHRYANGTAGISSASPTDPVRCNTVPIEIVFARPVRSVTLKFCGAAVVYTLKAFDAAGQALGQADCAVPAYPTPGAESSVSFAGADSQPRRDSAHSASPFWSLRNLGPAAGSDSRDRLGKRRKMARTDRGGATAASRQPVAALPGCGSRDGRGAQSAPVGTWKTLAFDDVLLRDNQAIEAVAYLRTLPELTAFTTR